MKTRHAVRRITLLSATGMVGLLLLLWLSAITPAHAQLSPNSQIAECVENRISQAQSEGRTASEQLRQRFEASCRRELSQQQRQRPQDQQATAVPGQFSEEQVEACILEGIRIARSGGRTLTQQLRRQITEVCRRDGALPEGQQTPEAPVTVSDEQLRECIRKVLGFVPAESRSLTVLQRAKIIQTCPEVQGRLGEVLRSGDGNATQTGAVDTVLDPATTECIQRILRLISSGSEGLTERQKRSILESCFGGEDVAPQQASTSGQLPAGQTATESGNSTEQALLQLLERQLELLRLEQERSEPVISDRELLGCIRNVLGGLPSSYQELQPRQRTDAIGACPGAAGRLEQLLSPASVEQSNEECIERVLGHRPASAGDLTGEERRLVEARCFRNRLVQGRLAAEDEGPRRGFFTNSQAGEAGSLEKLSNPTALAVLGILLTLFATAISLFRGN